MTRPPKHWIIAAFKAHVWPNSDGRIEQAAIDVLIALEAGGYVIVPREPTEAIIKAHHVVPDDNDFEERVRSNWKALIDAAQQKSS